jgi:hypothetical protein
MRKAAHSQGSPGTRGHGAADPSSLARAKRAGKPPSAAPTRRLPGLWTSRSRGCPKRRGA